jgi:transketolase
MHTRSKLNDGYVWKGEMRRVFAAILEEEMAVNNKIYLLTADIGFGVLDSLRARFPDRVINVGSSESLMLGIALGFAYEGRIVICYTITPFLIYRPFEMIRNYINYEKTPIKLVGCGRDKDYPHDGITHWAEDDETIMAASFPYIGVHKPWEITREYVKGVLYSGLPEYLNLTRN